ATKAALPADYTCTTADGGPHPSTAPLPKPAGATSPFIAAMDVATGVRSSANIVVNPLAAVSLSMSVASTTPVRIPASVVVSALDQYGNVATGYTGTVHFASSDPQAVLPADYTFTAADPSRATLTPTLNAAGTPPPAPTQTSTSASSFQPKISVIPVAAVPLDMSAAPTAPAGVPASVAVSALDQYGNVATGYTGTVHFASSDVQAVLPADYTF